MNIILLVVLFGITHGCDNLIAHATKVRPVCSIIGVLSFSIHLISLTHLKSYFIVHEWLIIWTYRYSFCLNVTTNAFLKFVSKI